MLRTEVENVLDSLRLRERRVLQLRFGLIDGQREQVRSLSRDRPVDTAACLRPGPVITPVAAVKLALKCLAQRHQRLSAELATLHRDLDWLVAAPAPTLCALKGVGTDVAGAMLVAAERPPERLRSEGAFANLCGVAPLPLISRPRTTWPGAPKRACPSLRSSGASSATSLARSIASSSLAPHSPRRLDKQ
jgi:transposase